MESHLRYAVWEKNEQKILEDLSYKRVLVPFSGGKDSSAILSLIQKASEKFYFNFETHGVLFPAFVYSKVDVKAIEAYWNKRNVNIIWHKAGVSDECLAKALKKGQSPCLTCMQLKKKVMMRLFNQMISDPDSIVIIMGYSLWDLVSATLEYITTSTFYDKNNEKALQENYPEQRFIETAQRFYPLLKIKGGPTIYKPLIKINDQDIKKYIMEKKIPLIKTPCTYKEFRPKRILATYYEKSDLSFEYKKVFDFSKKTFGIPDISYYEEMNTKDYITKVI